MRTCGELSWGLVNYQLQSSAQNPDKLTVYIKPGACSRLQFCLVIECVLICCSDTAMLLCVMLLLYLQADLQRQGCVQRQAHPQ